MLRRCTCARFLLLVGRFKAKNGRPCSRMVVVKRIVGMVVRTSSFLPFYSNVESQILRSAGAHHFKLASHFRVERNTSTRGAHPI
jgi:hypothetical protein